MKSSAPTGRRITAQGEALGNDGETRPALQGRNTRVAITPFQGLRIMARFSQGFAALHPGLFSAAPLGQRRKAVALLCRVIFLCCGLAVMAWACAWFGPVNSVRFNSYEQGHDFFRLPPLPRFVNRATGKPSVWHESLASERAVAELGEKNWLQEKGFESRRETFWANAASAESKDDWMNLRKNLEAFLQLEESPSSGRNSAIDRLDALQSLHQGASNKGLRAYLAIRAKYDEGVTPVNDEGEGRLPWAEAGELDQQLLAIPREAALRDNVAYLAAAVKCQQKDFEQAEEGFRSLVKQYPTSEKREAAQFMEGVAALKQSTCYAVENSDTGVGDCGDEASVRARQTFTRHLAQFPRGRLAADARGWLGYLARRSGDRAGAMIEYYRQLADTNVAIRMEAAHSLTWVRGGATLEDLARVEAELADEPQAALAYAYHNLYNYAYAVEPGTWNWYDDTTEKAERKTKAIDARQRIVDYAARMAERHAGASGAFLLRIAQAKSELEEPREALKIVRRALAMNLSETERRQALWVKGAAEYDLEDFASARLTLNALLAADAGRELTDGAHRMLAIVAERQSDWDEALTHYYALGYDTDVAYLLDVIMTPEQIAHFIEKRATLEQRNDLRYALGLRWLRIGRWNEARAAFAYVKTTHCAMPNSDGDWQLETQNKQRPKFDLEIPSKGICSEWLMRDLKTVDDLEALEQRVQAAADDETKAEALYQLASYQVQSSTEIFYNPRFWNHERFWLMASLAENASYLLPNESRLLWDYMNSHDVLARALPIYLEVAERYPNTKAAGDAMYTAAVCHERLSGMNNYWRGIYGNGLYAGARLVTYRDVRRAFPKYRFPRGTSGWEPMTRTVNGGPRWDPLPQPGPPLTRTQRWQIRFKRIHRILDVAVVQRADALLNGYVKPYYRWWTTTLSDGFNEWIAAVLTGLLTLACVETYNRRLAFSFGADWLLDLQRRQQPLEGLGLNLLGEEKRDDSKTPVERIIDDS